MGGGGGESSSSSGSTENPGGGGGLFSSGGSSTSPPEFCDSTGSCSVTSSDNSSLSIASFGSSSPKSILLAASWSMVCESSVEIDSASLGSSGNPGGGGGGWKSPGGEGVFPNPGGGGGG